MTTLAREEPALVGKRAALETTEDMLNRLHQAAEGARKNALRVQVDRAALNALLRDHAKLAWRFKVEGP